MHLKKTIPRNIRLLAIFNFCIEFKLYTAVAVIYFLSITNSFALSASIFSFAMFSSAIFELPTGFISDLIGRKKTIIMGTLANTLSIIFYAIGNNYTFLIIGAILEGLSRASFSGNNDAFLYDSLRDSHQKNTYGEYLGKITSALQFSLGIAAILGSIIASYSFKYLLWASVIPQCIALIIAVFLVNPINESSNKTNIFSHMNQALTYFKMKKKLRLISLGSIFTYAFGESTYQFQAAFVKMLWPLWAVGFANTMAHFAAALSYYFSGWILNRVNELKLLIADTIFSRIVTISALIMPTVFSPVLLSLSSLLFGIRMVAEGTLLQSEFNDKQRATMGSLNSLVSSIFFGIIVFLLGILADLTGLVFALIIVESMILVNVFIYLQIYRAERPIIVIKKMFNRKLKIIIPPNLY